MQKITIPLPPTTNETIKANRSGVQVGAGLKRKWTNAIANQCGDLKAYTDAIWVAIHITYRRTDCDPDNLFGSTKYLFDGLQKANIIPGDSVKEIKQPIYYTYAKVRKGMSPALTVYMFDDFTKYQMHIHNHLFKKHVSVN